MLLKLSHTCIINYGLYDLTWLLELEHMQSNSKVWMIGMAMWFVPLLDHIKQFSKNKNKNTFDDLSERMPVYQFSVYILYISRQKKARPLSTRSQTPSD